MNRAVSFKSGHMDIKNSTVAILSSRGKIVGTGFLASQNLVVTCAHVIVAAGAFYDDTVQVRFDGRTEKINALVVPEYWRDVDKGDVVVLRLESVPDGITPLPLANAAGSAGHDFYAYGYAIVTGVQGIGARGKIVDIVDNGRLVQLTSQEPDHGMSGGPVWDEQRRVVVGMVTKGKGLLEKDQNLRNTQTTFATTVEVIREVCPELRLTEICPYRSLDVFNEEDAPFFFGREKVVEKLVESLKREPRFLAVLGPSGSGKSSVVRAGLIPALRQGKVPGSKKWDIVTIRPANDPFEQLAGAGFINPKAGLKISVETWLEDRPDKSRLMLFIDQFEEVLVAPAKDIRQKFIAELAQLLDSPLAITVVLSLRDDFYSRFLHDAAILVGWLERGLVNTPPVLEQDDLHAMIVKPAKAVGLSLDEGLVDVIIADTCETDRSKSLVRSTILPLLEFALTQLWELREDERLTYAAYKIIDGTAGSLSQWADRVYYELSLGERKLVEQVFCNLIHLGDEREQIPDTRRVVPLDALFNGKHHHLNLELVDKLVRARLLSVHRNHGNQQQYVEIIHDALLREWNLFSQWIDAFRNREQRLHERRRRLVIIGLLFGLLLVLMLAALAWEQRNTAQTAANDRATALLDAENARVTAEVEASIRATAQVQAEYQRTLTLPRQLAAQAELLRTQSPNNLQLSLLLAIESNKRIPSLEAQNTILETVNKLPVSKFVVANSSPVTLVGFSGDGKKLITLGGKGDFWGNRGGEAYFFRDFDLPLTGPFPVVNNPEISQLSSPSWIIPEGSFGSTPSPRDLTYLAGYTGGWVVWDEITNIKIEYQILGKFTKSPSGKYRIILEEQSGETTALVQEVASNQVISEITHPEIISAVTFGSDSNLFLGGKSGHLYTHNIVSGDMVNDIDVGCSITSIAASPDGKMLSVACENGSVFLKLLPLLQDSLSKTTYSLPVTYMKFSKDGKRLAGIADQSAVVWQVPDLSIEFQMSHAAIVTDIAFSPDGYYLATGSNDYTAVVWELSKGHGFAVPSKIVSAPESAESWLSPGGQLFLALDAQGLMRIWDMDMPDTHQSFDVEHLTELGFSQDENRIWVAGDKMVGGKVWDVSKNEIVFESDLEAPQALSSTGRYVALLSLKENIINIYDIDAKVSNLKIQNTDNWYICAIAFMPADKQLLYQTCDPMGVGFGAVHLIDLEHNLGKELFSTETGYQRDLVINSSGDSFSGGRVLISVENFKITAGFALEKIAFSPNGKLLASAGGTDPFASAPYITIRNSPKGDRVVHVIPDALVNDLAFSYDDKYLASISDNLIQLWDASSGLKVTEVSLDFQGKAIRFVPDQYDMLVSGLDGVWYWSWDNAEIIQLACQHLSRNLSLDEWVYYMGDDNYQPTCPDLPSLVQ